jgi:hypothetical protein
MLKVVTESVKKGKDDETAQKKIIEPLVEKKQKGEALSGAENEQLQDGQDKLGRITQLNSRNSALMRGLLVLALQTSVQSNDTEKAKAILDDLQKGSDNIEGGVASILMQLVQQLKEQIDELKAQKGKEEDLKKTVASFSTFLDKLAERPKMSEDERIFLSHSYASLDRHKEAAKLLAEIPEPKGEEGKPVDPAKLGRYNAIRIMYVKQMRLAKDYQDAEKILSDILKTPFGKGNIEAQRERLMLKEDQGKFGGKDGAVQGWDQLMRQLLPRIQQNAKIKEQYFDCYYHLCFSLYKNALKIEDATKKDAGIKRAAGFVKNLDAAEKDLSPEIKKRFQHLLEDSPELKKEYESQGGAAFLAAVTAKPAE